MSKYEIYGKAEYAQSSRLEMVKVSVINFNHKNVELKGDITIDMIGATSNLQPYHDRDYGIKDKLKIK